MRTNQHLAQRNAEYLGQALELCASLPPEAYAAREPRSERGGVGAHVRHVLDHYDAFLDGLERGFVDYDARERDPATEADVAVARERLRATIARLLAAAARTESARELLIAADDHGDGARAKPSASSVGRELQYLAAHTVHHFALMAVALRAAGHEPGRDFGVASSTLRHEEESRGACAR
jgi:uncharacterized damage-inducible protein DinB